MALPAGFGVPMGLVLFVLTLTVGLSPIVHGAPLGSTPYHFPPFDSLQRGDRYVVRAEYERVRADRSLEMRRVRYASDGERVSALIAFPHPAPRKPLPTVLFLRGGAMAYMALRRGVPVRAAAVWGAFTDLDSLMEGDPRRYSKMGPLVWKDWAERRREITDGRSAARWPAEIRAPVLIFHGGADDEVPLSHPLRLVGGLERAGTPYRWIVIGGQGHTLRGATAERDAAIVSWFREHDRK